MVYITVRQSPMYHQMTLEEFLFSSEPVNTIINANTTNTRTYKQEKLGDTFKRKVTPSYLIDKLRQFNVTFDFLHKVEDRHELYRRFCIPKKSGGLRQIDAPNDELMGALRLLKDIFENDFHALYHTSAFAYVKGRNTVDAMKRHQENESMWYAKYDLKNFFGSTTVDFVMKMFSIVYPFSEVISIEEGKQQLEKALSLAFLDGVLPQGTPISPLITNIMMIPVDYELTHILRDYNNQRYVNTRYADDFQISSKYNFDVREIEGIIKRVLKDFGAPFTVNEEKTRYGSRAGSNWNLGVMINKDNQITVGYQNKRRFKAMLSSFAVDTKSGNLWPKEDIHHLEGIRNYYTSVEGRVITQIVDRIGQKYNMDIAKEIKTQLYGN